MGGRGESSFAGAWNTSRLEKVADAGMGVASVSQHYACRQGVGSLTCSYQCDGWPVTRSALAMECGSRDRARLVGHLSKLPKPTTFVTLLLSGWNTD
jgi:hypothetical protein